MNEENVQQELANVPTGNHKEASYHCTLLLM